MGFWDYAWKLSLQPDNEKLKILLDERREQPVLEIDSFGYTLRLPTFHIENERFVYAGQLFRLDTEGKTQIATLFRASVSHVTVHTIAPLPKEKVVPSVSKGVLREFAKRMVNDVYVNAHIRTHCPERFTDIAFANALAYQKIKPAERIFLSSTRLLTSLMTKLNVGVIKGSLSSEEKQIVNLISGDLLALQHRLLASFSKGNVSLEDFDERVDFLVQALEPFGPFLEVPSFWHMESAGRCSIYSDFETPNNLTIEELFQRSLSTLTENASSTGSLASYWKPEQEAEALQAFNSDRNQKDRCEKILAKLSPYVAQTNFRSISFPEEDYTQYLRARRLVQGTSRRLLDALRNALNYLDEDPRQEIGQLDLSAVIQAIASNKPATDVFLLDEYLKQSFAWAILLDVSKSMQVRGEYGRALAIAVAEAAKEFMLDSTSWSFFGFNDKIFVLKDSSESYSQRVRARIGGLKFDGLTFIPDAVHVAGKMLAKRFEEQRVLIVISDGWPYGYESMPLVLRKNVDDLLRKGVIVIGIGVETDGMGKFFRLNSSIYTPKDLIKKFANVYVEASAKALET